MHQIHDSCGEAEAIVVVMMMRWWRRWAMRMVRGSGAGPMHLMHRGAAAASMSAVSSAIVSGRGEGCAAKGETCEGCHDEFLVVVHNTPSLSVLLVSGARPSCAHIEEGRLPRKT